jgi:hypothetical protein
VAEGLLHRQQWCPGVHGASAFCGGSWPGSQPTAQGQASPDRRMRGGRHEVPSGTGEDVAGGLALGDRAGSDGWIETAGVIRSGRSRARVIAARTVSAEGAWYSQKQVSSSGTRTAPRNRTGAPGRGATGAGASRGA